jgi:hypothetical protein
LARKSGRKEGVIFLSNSGKDKGRTVVKTFRMEESLARTLKKDADDEGMTANALLNRIVGQHYGWGKKAREFGLISIHKPMFVWLIEHVDEKTLAQFGTEVVVDTWKQMAEYWLQDSSPDKMLEVLRLRARLDSQTETKTTREGDTYTMVFRNDYGPKFGIVAESAIKEFVRNSFGVEPQVSRGDTIVTARFKVS